jgi:hypothetical protein
VFGEASKPSSIFEEPFFTFEEFSNLRKAYTPLLTSAFDELMLKPSVRDIRLAKEMGPFLPGAEA